MNGWTQRAMHSLSSAISTIFRTAFHVPSQVPPMPRILVIKTSSMGDVIHNLPIVADLHRARPDAIVDWVVEEAYIDLVRMHPGVANVIPIALRRWRAEGLGAATREERHAFRAQLREHAYDVVLDTQGLLKSALIARSARLAEGGVRAGFSFGLVREGLARLFYDRGYRVDRHLHAVERLRALAAAALGYAGTELGMPQFGLHVPPQRFEWLGEAEPDAPEPSASDALCVSPAPRRYVVLLYATARAEKAWPPERWKELIHSLDQAGIVPVLPWGNAAEEAMARGLALDSAAPNGAIVAPRLSLTEAAALLAGASGVVGVDTGLTHLSAALDVRTVGLFGATPRWRYAPYWTPRAINLGNFGELGAQPSVAAVADALRRLGVLEGDGGHG